MYSVLKKKTTTTTTHFPFTIIVCAAGKIYLMSVATCVSFEPLLHIAQKLTRCEPLTHHIHIQSIYNNLKRGLIVSTHQLLSSPIFEYNTLGIMHNGCDRQVLHTSLTLRQSEVPCIVCQFSCCCFKGDTCSSRHKVCFASRTHNY